MLHAEPGPALEDDPSLHAEVEELALLADTVVVDDVELDLPERGRHLVLHHGDLGAVAHHLVTGLQLADPPDVEAHGAVELQRAAPRRRLRAAEHHADLLADLVDEDDHAVGLGDRPGQLPQSLAHEAGMETDEAVPHLALDLSARHEGRDRVHDDDVDGVRADEGLHDLEGLLAGVGLAHEEVVELDAEPARVGRVQSVLGIHEGTDAPRLLSTGDGVQGEGGLARALRAVDLDDAPTRKALAAQREIERDGARGDSLDALEQTGLVAQAHDRAGTVGLLDVAEGRGQGLVPPAGRGNDLVDGLALLAAHGGRMRVALSGFQPVGLGLEGGILLPPRRPGDGGDAHRGRSGLGRVARWASGAPSGWGPWASVPGAPARGELRTVSAARGPAVVRLGSGCA